MFAESVDMKKRRYFFNRCSPLICFERYLHELFKRKEKVSGRGRGIPI
jgi:hypothetical protein